MRSLVLLEISKLRCGPATPAAAKVCAVSCGVLNATALNNAIGMARL